MSLPPNSDYAADAKAIDRRIQAAIDAHYGACAAVPRFVYLGVAERNILTMALGYVPGKVRELPVVPVALSSWLKVGL